MAKKQIKALNDGRGINDDIDSRDEYRTDMMCRPCGEWFDSAKEPYVTGYCYRCWGKNAGTKWRQWMETTAFTEIFKEAYPIACKGAPNAPIDRPYEKSKQRMLKCIERVIRDPRINVQHIWDAFEYPYQYSFTYWERYFWRKLRSEMREGFTAILAAPLIEQPKTVVRTKTAPKLPDDQLTLKLDVAIASEVIQEILIAPKAVQPVEEQQLKLDLFSLGVEQKKRRKSK